MALALPINNVHIRWIDRLPKLVQAEASLFLSPPDDPLIVHSVILRLTYALTPALMLLALVTPAPRPTLPPVIIFELGTIMLALTWIEDRLLRRRVLPSWMPAIHLVMGLVVLAVAVTNSGGVQSPFAWMFALTMAIEGMLRGRSWAFTSATLATILLGGSMLLANNSLAPLSNELIPSSIVETYFTRYVAMFYITAAVATGIGAWARHQNREVAKLTKRVQQSYMGVIRALGTAVATRDSFTADHCDRVERSAILMARLIGCPEEEVEQIRVASLLHDLGKIGVPDAILYSTNPLRPSEVATLRRHAIDGAAILGKVPFLEEAAEIVRHSHERFDGMGYPDGLEGDAIPLGSRIIAVIDAYESMTSVRPWRPSLSHEIAVEQLQMRSGGQFDPRIAKLFIRLLEWEGPETALRETIREESIA
jgi:putative nucleotidyltransferase with HDIG domain